MAVVAPLPPVQIHRVATALILAIGMTVALAGFGVRSVSLFAVGLALGLTLYHATLGFTGAYRRFILHRDISGITAQLVMLGVAMLLFAPVLAGGTVFGYKVTGAVAPVGMSMLLGAFVFGIGMQLGGGCGSGTLFNVGRGDARMIVTLVFFCIGGFWGSLDLSWWRQWPEMESVSLGVLWGYGPAVAVQLSLLVLLYVVIRSVGGHRSQAPTQPQHVFWRRILRGPWPLLWGAVLLALLNWITLLIAGHPWSITWAMTLWGAKGAVVMGWDPATSAFWSGSFQQKALSQSVLADTTSIMNFGIMIGALLAAGLAGRDRLNLKIPPRALMASVIGGLMLGYGARLAYGCNIGAFFSGVASTSLHGWAWILAAFAGNWMGVKIRPRFGLD